MKRLAIITHDTKKVDLVARATFNRETPADLIITGFGRLEERHVVPELAL